MTIQKKRMYATDHLTHSEDIIALIGAERGKNYQARDFQDIASIEEATDADLIFCWSKDLIPSLSDTKSRLIIVSPDLAPLIPDTLRPLIVRHPYVAFAKLARHLYPSVQQLEVWEPKDHAELKGVRVHKTASVHPSAVIGKGTAIDAGVVIGPHVVIGEETQIFANAVITHATIGDHVTIYAGAVIGHAGFGFVPTPTGPIDRPHLGRVIIGDNVRVGAHTAIDRGLIGPTVIGDGCRIDNLVQIAHNVVLGPRCVIVAQVGIAGSTRVGEGTMMGGQVGVSDHLIIGQNVKIAAQSGVMRTIEDNGIVGGSPALPIKEWHRQTITLQRLSKK